MLQGETMSIMFADGAEAPSTNIMYMVSPYAPGFALWNNSNVGPAGKGNNYKAMHVLVTRPESNRQWENKLTANINKSTLDLSGNIEEQVDTTCA